MLRLKDVEHLLNMDKLPKRPIRKHFKAYEDYRNALDSYEQVMRHVIRGLPRPLIGKKNSEDSSEKSPDTTQDTTTE